MRSNYLLKQLGLLGAEGCLGLYDARKKEVNSTNYIWYFLNKLQSMYKLRQKGKDSYIYDKNFHLSLFTQGYAGLIEHEGKIKCLLGHLEGELDENYDYKYFRVDNPYADINKRYTIGEDCSIIYNDSLHIGVLPLLEKYGSLISEAELSFYMALINTRNQFLISAQDDKTLKAANKYLTDLEKGELGAIGEAAFMDSLKTAPLGEFNNFTYILEALRYLYAQAYNELGINAVKEQKREALASAEVGANTLSLLPLVEDFTNCREDGIKKSNELWQSKGYDIELSIKLNSAWEVTEKQAEAIAEGDIEEDTVAKDIGEEVVENGSEQNTEE